MRIRDVKTPFFKDKCLYILVSLKKGFNGKTINSLEQMRRKKRGNILEQKTVIHFSSLGSLFFLFLIFSRFPFFKIHLADTELFLVTFLFSPSLSFLMTHYDERLKVISLLLFCTSIAESYCKHDKFSLKWLFLLLTFTVIYIMAKLKFSAVTFC